MNKLQGFSLIEVLIALFLITTTSFALLEQQLQLRQLIHQTLNHSLQFNLQTNSSERTLYTRFLEYSSHLIAS